jgi:hypothetical protein
MSDCIIGIDLGTYYSGAAVYRKSPATCEWELAMVRSPRAWTEELCITFTDMATGQSVSYKGIGQRKRVPTKLPIVHRQCNGDGGRYGGGWGG